MGHFNKFSAQGGPASGWGGRDRGNRGGRSDGPKQMFPAVCGKCGDACQVPFRPTGDRPVFCSNCFKAHPSTHFVRSGQDSGNDRPRFAPKRFDGGNRDAGARVSAPDYSAQFASLNAKLDKLISILAPVKVEKVDPSTKAQGKKEETLRLPSVAQGKEKKVKAKKAKSKKK